VACATLVFQWIGGAPQNEIIRGRTATINEYGVTMNDFTQTFLTEVLDDLGQGNFVFSPFSLHAAVAVCTSGATDGSRTSFELLDALGRFPNIQAIENRYKLLLEAYDDQAIKEMLIFGTRFWSAQGYQNLIQADFQNLLKETYRSELTELGPNPTEEINNWVKEKTKGKIDHIMDEVSGDARFIIVNALYFNGAWTKTFEDAECQDFTHTDGTKTKMEMMVRKDSNDNTAATFQTNLRSNVNYNVVAIPYEDPDWENRFEMVIIMPENHRELAFLQHELQQRRDDPTTDNIFDAAQQALDGAYTRKMTITMPKFSIDSKVDVAKYFKRMDVTAPFTEGGFERILADEPLKVSQIKHRAILEVTKNGTVAAATTAIEIGVRFGDFGEAEVLNINKPFLFFLRDKVQKTILFAGRYGGPDDATKKLQNC